MVLSQYCGLRPPRIGHERREKEGPRLTHCAAKDKGREYGWERERERNEEGEEGNGAGGEGGEHLEGYLMVKGLQHYQSVEEEFWQKETCKAIMEHAAEF